MLSDAQVCAFWAHVVPCSCPSKTVQQLLANKQVLFKKSVCGNRHRNWKMTHRVPYQKNKTLNITETRDRFLVYVCLCMHRSAERMSEIMHYLCQLDTLTQTRSSGGGGGAGSSSDLRPRMSALVFVVRQWARSVGITGVTVGAGFTNFMLNILVIFFLQTRRSPLLPPLHSIKSISSGLHVVIVF